MKKKEKRKDQGSFSLLNAGIGAKSTVVAMQRETEDAKRMVLSVDPSPRTLVRRSSKKTLRLSVYRRKIWYGVVVPNIIITSRRHFCEKAEKNVVETSAVSVFQMIGFSTHVDKKVASVSNGALINFWRCPQSFPFIMIQHQMRSVCRTRNLVAFPIIEYVVGSHVDLPKLWDDLLLLEVLF